MPDEGLEPSAESLAEMPEVDLKDGRWQANPYAERIAREGYTISVGRGRPKKGTETGPTWTRSIRFPNRTWKNIELVARAEGLTVHAALRVAVTRWLVDWRRKQLEERAQRPDGADR